MPAIRAAFALGLALCFLTPATQAYRVMLSPGAASNTTDATNLSLWTYSAANADGAKYGGTWGNNVYTPKADRQQIVANFHSQISMVEDVYYNFSQVDSLGNPVPLAWVTNRTLPPKLSSHHRSRWRRAIHEYL